jgi:Ferritin-like domain
MTLSCCDVSVMKTTIDRAANGSSTDENRPLEDNLENRKPRKRSISRRSFLSKTIALGAGTVGAGVLGSIRTAEASGALSAGDAALLRFPAALELLEADFWTQYNELGGIFDSEVPGGHGNPAYIEALEVIEDEMRDYIHDNTDDEISHHQFLNAYLVERGAAPANLGAFHTLMGSTATGVNQSKIGHRLTNLTQLTIDTSWWTRYRDDSHNPDLDPNFVFPQAVPTLATNRHTAIPRTDADTSNPNFLQAIANTAAFHFPTIEQGGTSLYAAHTLRATDPEVARILMSIGPTETMHFQTWSDVAGNAPPLTAVDPVTGVSVTFPDLEVEDELFDKALIMPEPCPFLRRSLPIVSIIRPTKTRDAAMTALGFLTAMGLFIGQSQAFFAYMTQLAQEADAATRGV